MRATGIILAYLIVVLSDVPDCVTITLKLFRPGCRLIQVERKCSMWVVKNTITQVRTQVKALGMVCGYQSEYQEFRVDYLKSDSRWSVDSAYFTTDPDDAVATARAMASWNIPTESVV
jgi:hypothetical protein